VPFNHTLAQYGTTRGLILLTGEILQEDGITPLQDVHVYNQNNRQVNVSDPTGFFSMYVSKVHVLRFSSVGYEPFYFSIPGDFSSDVYYVQIEMKSRTVPLRAITIYGEEEKTVSMLTREKSQNSLGDIQLGTLRGKAKPVEPTLENPMSLLWDWFSREGKEKRKLKAILARDEIRSAVDKRFESDLIWELTGLYGEELEKFKRYCNLPEGFVIDANEYDFLLSVKSCYYKYKNQVP
jgi:hypothetical protein